MCFLELSRQALGSSLTSENEGWPPRRTKSQSCFSHWCGFMHAFCLAASYLSSVIVWPPRAHAVPLVHWQNGNKEEEVKAESSLYAWEKPAKRAHSAGSKARTEAAVKTPAGKGGNIGGKDHAHRWEASLNGIVLWLDAAEMAAECYAQCYLGTLKDWLFREVVCGICCFIYFFSSHFCCLELFWSWRSWISGWIPNIQSSSRRGFLDD